VDESACPERGLEGVDLRAKRRWRMARSGCRKSILGPENLMTSRILALIDGL
jgi:hypothetical protein